MTGNLWTSADMEKAAGGAATAGFAAGGISIDTRTLRPGDAYLALEGAKLDGHDYVEEAFRKGACAAIVRAGFAGAAGPLLRVEDTLRTLWDLGRAGRARARARIIGVTGSTGKTGTKDMLASMLSAQGATHASRRSFNNHWGVPLTLANLPPGARFAVVEMGMNHAGELENLSALARPHIAIVTTIEPAHTEFFGSVEEIADAKAEIFRGMEGPGAVAILPRDNPHFPRLEAHARAAGVERVIGFGEDEEAQSRMTDCALHADSSRVSADIMGARVKYRLAIPGRHIALNSVAALTAVKAAGGDLAAAARALKDAAPVAGRGNRLEVEVEAGAPPLVIIDESYNANPASMAAALGVLEMARPQGGGRRIAVLGDMLELGAEGAKLHAGLANAVLKARAELVFCCGPLMDALYQQLPPGWRGGQAQDSRALAALVAQAARPGDVVLVKGSLGSKMAYVVEALQSLSRTQPREQTHAV